MRIPSRMKVVFAVGVLVIGGIGLWLVPQARGEHDRRGDGVIVAAAAASSEPRAVGTSGVHEGAAETANGAVLTEIETITGANDGMALVGRRVDLHVDVLGRATDRAFWVGSHDNRVLVVLAGEIRGGAHGGPPGHRIAPVRGGQRAAISGMVRPVPKADERQHWNLATRDEQELLDRKIFIRADVVSPEGHGAH